MMGEINDIRIHPKFRGRLPFPNKELSGARDAYIEKALMRLAEGNPIVDTREHPNPGEFTELAEDPPATGLANCSLCKHRIFRGHAWASGSAWDFVCGASPRIQCTSPITGQRGFLPQGVSLAHDELGNLSLQKEEFEHCLHINLYGTCPRFEIALVE